MKSVGSPLSPMSKQRSHEGGAGRSWDVEVDISALLSKHSVEEVRQIEQKTRLDIERKKEELRQMVGERYRDLIDAADSIMDLNTGSKQVGASVNHLVHVCQALQHTHFVRGLGGMKGPPSKNETHQITAQFKLLGDSPEKIWHCLEQQQYLEATRLFLQARHTHTQLQVTLSKNSLLRRLWQSTSTFRLTILECCKRHLQATEQSREAMLSSLCAIVLLEGCTLRQVFSKFLLAQKTAIQSVFHPSKQMHCSVKAQISEVVSVISRSIILIATIFSITPGQGSSPLFKAVNDFIKTHKRDGGRLSVSEVPSSDVQASSQEWLTACVDDVSQGVKPLLYHVTSVKGLNSIRAALHVLLAQPEEKVKTTGSLTEQPSTTSSAHDVERDQESSCDVGEWSDQWKRYSELVTGEYICIWERFLQHLFFERAQAILTKHFFIAEDHAVKSLRQLIDDIASDPELHSHDINVTSRLWVEESQQSHGGGGRGRGKRQVGERINTLSLKTKACTPGIYSFCLGVAEKLKVILEDAGHYLLPQTSDTFQSHSHIVTIPTKGVEFPFRLHGDHGRMQEFLQSSTVQYIKRFLSKVHQLVAKLQTHLQTEQNQLSSTVEDRLLVIARVCRALNEVCIPLSLLSLGTNATTSTPVTRIRARGQKTVKRKEVDDETNTIKQLLSTQCLSIHKIWAECSAQRFVSVYKDQLLSSNELNTLASTLVWDEITIVEEAESGKQVASVIKVPSQASVYVISLLFSACQEISRIGGHAMERSILQHFSGKCLQGVLEVHQSLLTSDPVVPMHQNCALQLLFNIRFICSVLSSPKDMEESNAKLQQSVIGQLQAHIDPFDLDVFTPHILLALERQLQRSTVLLGLLLALRGSVHHFLLSGQKPQPSSTQEKHIVVPLFPSTHRFPSLPIANPSKPIKQHLAQCPVADVQVPKTFLETVAFFHHM